MAKEPVWTRAYLKSIGAQDNEIDYQNGAVTYKNKPFQYTTPQADGKAYGSQNELESAYKSYQNNDAMEQLKASSANRMGEANTALGQYKQNISKAPTPFAYDANSIKSDPLYTSGLQSLQNDAQTATNQSLVNLGRRGIGNSQSAVTSANAQQQNVVNQANTKLMPQVIAQKYQAYLDANSQQDKQNQNLLGYANSLIGLGQQEFNNSRLLGSDLETANQNQFSNNRLTNQDTFNNNLATRQDSRAESQITGNYMPPGAKESISAILALKQQAEQNGVTPEQMSQFKSAADAERNKLYQMGVDPNVVGFDSDYATASKAAADYRGIPTLQGQGQTFNQNLANRQEIRADASQKLNETQVNAQLRGTLPDGTPTYAAGQDAIQNSAQYAGMYNGQPTMQKIMQTATIANMTADNLRSAATEARAIGKEDLALKMDIWEKTGQAPSGIPGVTAGSSLAGKTKTPLSVQDAQNILLKTPFITEETNTDALGNAVKTGKTKIDKPGLVQAIAGLGMSDEQMDSLFLLNGISDKEVQEISKQLRASRGN